MNSQKILEEIKNHFSDAVLAVSEPYGFLTIEIEKDKLKEIIKFLQTIDFLFLTDICGIHYPENKERELGVIYHFHFLQTNVRFRLKTFLPKENPEIESITDLFAGANWLERETFDFYGIQFKGHPDLRVILNDENLGYHPMLKHYKLEDETRTDKNDAMFGR